MKKLNLSEYKSMSDYEKQSLYRTVYGVYMEDNLSSIDTCKKLNLSSTVLDAIKKDFNMRKSKTQITECMKTTCESKFGTPYYDVSDGSSMTIAKFEGLAESDRQKEVDNFKAHYIDENLSIENAAKVCGISSTFAAYLVDYANLHKSPDKIQKSRIKTNIERYGVEHAAQSKEIQDKIKSTVNSRYGVDYVMQNKSVLDKHKEAMISHYGADHMSKIPELYQKARNTMKNKYGVEYTGQSSELRKKMQDTCVSRYGVTNYMQSEESKTKFILDYYVNRSNIPESSYALLLNKDALLSFILSVPEADRTYVKLAHKLSVPESSFNQIIHKYGLTNYIVYMFGKSNTEDEIANWLSSIVDIQRHNRDILSGKELDIYIPKYQLAIEYNGSYWHSTERLQDYKYHQNKSLDAKNEGVFIYHIFEHEWLNLTKQNIIKSQLAYLCHTIENKVYARNCYACNVSVSDAKDFLNTNHLQGYRNGSIFIGLRTDYDNELVSLMSFGTAYLSRDNKCWELHRFCNKLNTNVSGAFSKLFSYFRNTYHPKKLITFSDFSKGTGDTYRKCGFDCITLTSPNYVWVNSNTFDVVSRYKAQMPNEIQMMHDKGYMQVHDCGNYKWLYDFDKLY